MVKARKNSKVIRLKAGSTEVAIYSGMVRGVSRYTLAFHSGGRRVRRTFSDLEVAKIEGRRVAAHLQAGRHEAAGLPLDEMIAARTAFEMLKPLGVPLVVAIEEYVRCRAVLKNSPVLPAVMEYARRSEGLRLGATVPQVIAEFMKAKEQDGVRPLYLAGLKSRLNQFSRTFSEKILEVKSHQIDEWLRATGRSARTRNTILKRVHTMFAYAKAQNYLPKNEPTEAEAVGRAKEEDTNTEIFTVEQMQKLLNHANKDMLGYLAIGAFAGLRVVEIGRLSWDAVNLERGLIELRANQAKTASRRLVPISDNLKAWLQPIKRVGPIMPEKLTSKMVHKLAAKLGIRWPNNVLRHSYISYRIAIVKSAEQVALEAGNSPAIIFRHYRELTTEAQANAWFAIMPQ